MTDNDEDLRRTCTHEAGHSVTAWALGFVPGMVTARQGGPLIAGCSWWTPASPVDTSRADTEQPFMLWPSDVREFLERRAVGLMAGDVAELSLAWPVIGRRPAPFAERVEELPDLPPLTPDEETSIVEEIASETSHSDEEQVAIIALTAFGEDLASRAAWLRYIEATATDLVLRHRGRIDRLAALLIVSEGQSLSAAAVRRVVDGPDAH